MPHAHHVLDEARRELARFPLMLDTLVGDLDEATWRARPLPDEWAPIEIVCHLRDEEAEDFGARVRVILEGGGWFTPIDPERWARERGYRDAEPHTALAAFRTFRAASLDLLASAAPEHLRVAVEQPGLGRLSGLDLLVAWVTHDRLHLNQLAGTLARLWASRWSPLRAEYAGPIPYADTGRGRRSDP